MKKILIIITTGFYEHGGLTTVMMNYMRKIDFSSFQIDFASYNEPERELLDEISILNCHYYRLPNRNNNTLCYMYALYQLAKNYDVIHVNANSATAVVELLPARCAGVKIRIAHNHTEKCDHIVIHNILSLFFKRLYTKAIACSSKAGNWVFGENNYIILNNGIDVEKYKFRDDYRTEIRQKYRIAPNEIVLGHVGKIYKPKNHGYLIEIFKAFHAEHPNSKLLLVGDGELKEEIEKRVFLYGLKDSVIFAGMQTEVSKYLAAIDVFVFPSLWEGMPLALIEAQANGIMCIASDCIDPSVKITRNIIQMSIEEEPEKWAKKIDQILSYDRNIMAEDSVSLIIQSGYDVKQNVKILENIYRGNA